MKGLFLKIRDKLFLNSVRSAFRDESALLRSEIAKRIDDSSSKQSQALDLVSARQGEIQAGLAQLAEKVSTLEKKLFISEVQRHYQDVRKEIAGRIKAGEKLRFASYVVYDTTFGAHGICELMLKEPEKYDVTFVVCPDTYRDMDGLKQYHKTKQFFVERYGADRVLDGYDETTGEFLDHSDKFDVVYLANPYDCLVNRVHGINYLCTQNLLPIYINYMFISMNRHFEHDEEKVDSCLYYKYFLNTCYEKSELESCRIVRLCDNLVVSGYPKMDSLACQNYVPHKSKRKKILICPHHTVKVLEGEFQLSNFLEYSDLILRLPDLYPDVDFVFRPHPLLFTNLTMHGVWTDRQVNDYLSALKTKGVVYSTEGDYFHLFVECDAIIHDCASFISEWLYTGKPCCYVIDTDNGLEKIKNVLSKEGWIAFSNYILADNEVKIKEFIDKVINDELSIGVSKDVEKRIMVNYPNASKWIFENFLNEKSWE